MRSFALLPLAAALATCANAGALDFISELVSIVESTVTFSTANYVITNVGTGKNLYFARDGTVGTYTGDSTVGVNLEKVTYSDVSGKSVTGMVVSGTTSDTLKCLAAQWNFKTPARDEYAVPYECQLGSNGNGQNNQDTNKGLWVFNEVTCSGSTDDSSSTVDVGVQLNAKVASSSSSDDSSDDSSATTTAEPTATSTDDSEWAPSTTQSVDKQDQSTWVCQHPGWWLYAHQGYVTEGGHVECADDLAAYKATLSRMTRRSRADLHSEIARRSVAKRSSKCYTIHPLNHLADMKTLALTGNSDTGFASTPALNLAYADDTDPVQQWTVSSA